MSATSPISVPVATATTFIPVTNSDHFGTIAVHSSLNTDQVHHLENASSTKIPTSNNNRRSNSSHVVTKANVAMNVNEFIKSNDLFISTSSFQEAIQSVSDSLTELAHKIAVTPIDDANGDMYRKEFQIKSKDFAMLVESWELLKKLSPSSTSKSVDKSNHSFIVPPNLPCFQWKGGFVFDHKLPIFSDIKTCLLKFQDILFSHGLDFNQHFMRLVPLCMASIQRMWYDEFLLGFNINVKPPTWEEFKLAITIQYGSDYEKKSARAALELMKLQMSKAESIDEFIHRFKVLCSITSSEALPDNTLINFFLHALPSWLSEKVMTAKAGLDKNIVVTIEEIIAMTKNLYKTFHQNKPIVKPTNINSKRPSINDLSKNKVTKKYAPPPSSKFCPLHKSSSHDFKECRAWIEINKTMSSMKKRSKVSSTVTSVSTLVEKKNNHKEMKCSKCNSIIRNENKGISSLCICCSLIYDSNSL